MMVWIWNVSLCGFWISVRVKSRIYGYFFRVIKIFLKFESYKSL